IKQALCLNNGGLLIELNSTEAAAWLKSDSICDNLTNSLGIQAIIRDQLYQLLVPYLPISTSLESPATLCNIKPENSLTCGTIAQVKWVKPLEKQAMNQRVAHTILMLCNPMSANLLICNSIYHKQEKFFPRKDKKEAICCMCCQLWGHIAKYCKVKEDTCEMCGDLHRTSVCTNRNKLFCVSCSTNNHASHNRACREFENCCTILDAKIPENLMPYFPTDIPWTQVLLPPKANLSRQERPFTQATAQRGLRQTTLNGNPGFGPPVKRPRPDTVNILSTPSPLRCSTNPLPQQPAKSMPHLHSPMNEHDHAPPTRLCIWQQNLNKSQVTQLSLLNSPIANDWDILAIQEPHIMTNGNTDSSSSF
ncbi:hypothetical protein PAXRUDRAFT_161158, partial [Paxillus rubicundulus Ve08.2h10]